MRLNPFAGNYLTDPATTWHELLDGPAVRYAEDLGMWLITRHEHVRRALGDSEVFRNQLTLAPVYEVCPEALGIVMQIDAPPTTAAADAPVHTRTRRALRSTFANTSVRVEQRYGDIVRRRAAEVIGRAAEHSTLDIVSELSTELPLLVLVDILGVPEHDIPRIKAWADGQIALVWGDPPPDEQIRLAQGLLDFWRYCQAMVADLLTQDDYGEGFVGDVLRYRAGDDSVLTEAEAASLAFNLLVAGHETTAGLLAHSLDLALTEPERWARLVADPSRIPAFVEEVMRYSPAIDGWLRVTAHDVRIDDVTIPAGSRCLLMLGAANRDPEVFTHPDEFDPARADLRDHLSFGYGPHYCIGAALARLEAETALAMIVAEMPSLRLAEGHVRSYKPNVAFRAHTTLPAQVGPRPPAGPAPAASASGAERADGAPVTEVSRAEAEPGGEPDREPVGSGSAPAG